MYDMVYIGPKSERYNNLKQKYTMLKHAKDVDTAKALSMTKMLWIIWDNIQVCDDFNFDYKANQWSQDVAHVFKNGDTFDGIVLIPKHTMLAAKEVEYRFLSVVKEVDIIASIPVPYDVFTPKTYEEYLLCAEQSTTDMFWVIWDDVDLNYDLSYYIPMYDTYHKGLTHIFLNNETHDGICLFSKDKTVSKNEFQHRFFANKKEVDIVASKPKAFDKFIVTTYEQYLECVNNSTTEMFWMIWHDVDVNYDFSYYVPKYDTFHRSLPHVCLNGEYKDGICLMPTSITVSEKEFKHRFFVNKKELDIVASTPRPYEVFHVSTYNDYINAKETSKFEMFWLTFDDIDVQDNFKFDIYFPHYDTYNRNINHVFKNGKYYDGVILASKNETISEREFLFRFLARKKEQDILASMPAPYDVVFISYNEPNADENYRLLKEKVPNAKRIHGVKGIHQAHIEAAKQCNTPMFYIVDGDALIMDDFNFNHQVAAWQYDHVFVWRSQNPINDMVYGYGGLKLFPTQLTIDMDTTKPDMTTSISKKFNAMPGIANITAFNTGPFETWKSAFRECAKLSSKVIDRQKEDETNERLKIWTTVGHDRPFGEHAIRGARAGMQYGLSNKSNLRLINDFDWLREQFDANI